MKDSNPTFGAGHSSLLSLRYERFDVVSYFCKNMSKICVMQGHPARCERPSWQMAGFLGIFPCAGAEPAVKYPQRGFLVQDSGKINKPGSNASAARFLSTKMFNREDVMRGVFHIPGDSKVYVSTWMLATRMVPPTSSHLFAPTRVREAQNLVYLRKIFFFFMRSHFVYYYLSLWR